MFDQQIKAHCCKWGIYCLIPHSDFANRHGAALISAQCRTFGSIPNRESFRPAAPPRGQSESTPYHPCQHSHTRCSIRAHVDRGAAVFYRKSKTGHSTGCRPTWFRGSSNVRGCGESGVVLRQREGLRQLLKSRDYVNYGSTTVCTPGRKPRLIHFRPDRCQKAFPLMRP